MAYFLEIPPLMKDGRIFINSSPHSFKTSNDYACINHPYYALFTGVDPDGDSLAYSLVSPLNSSSSTPVPRPQPKPNLSILYASGFSLGNIISGSRPVRISNKGLFTATPDQAGTYVFAVKIEEYRDREKIGEAIWEFQILVVSSCSPPDPPRVSIEDPSNPSFDPDRDTLRYMARHRPKCFNFKVSNLTPGEMISLRAEGVNFSVDFNDIFRVRRVINGSGNFLDVLVCLPDCPPVRGVPFILDLIAEDDSCPISQLDTARLKVLIEPPPNAVPIGSGNTTMTLNLNSAGNRLITGTDTDGDNLTMQLFVEGISDPTLYGFNLINVTDGTAGTINGNVTWDTNCTTYNFSEIQNFRVGVIIEDADQCLAPGDTIFIDARVILPANARPMISTNTPIPSQLTLGSTLEVDRSCK